MRSPLQALCFLLLCFAQQSDSPASDLRPVLLQHEDPKLVIPSNERTFDARLIPLWREALLRPEAEYQRQAALAVLQAQTEGFSGLAAAQPELRQVLTAAQTSAQARLAAAQALVALNLREEAPVLLEAARQHGGDFRQIIEPALAAWNYEPVRIIWRQRLTDSTVTRRDLLLAMQGLGQVKDKDALPALLKLAGPGHATPAVVRLSAARAAADITDSGLEAQAEPLMNATATIIDRLCAVSLLKRHQAVAAQALLIRLAQDQEPSVAAAALETLFLIDPALVLPLASQAAASRDVNVRRVAARTWITLPDPQRVATLARLLDDPHPGLRSEVCEALLQHAQQPSLDEVIRTEATKLLSEESWRGQEQAALLLAALDHKTVAPRLVELLESSRPEVMIASAFSLRRLAVTDTLPALLDKAQRQTDHCLKESLTPPAVDIQVAHLFEAMGRMRYSAAEPLMRQHVPKNLTLGAYARAGAIYALGWLYEDRVDEQLAKQLMARLMDSSGEPPEVEPVRLLSAISIGRMKAQSQLASLKKLAGSPIRPDPVSHAVRWSVQQISGEEIPLEPMHPQLRGGWFLERLSSAPAQAR